jgi:hypothetical protein
MAGRGMQQEEDGEPLGSARHVLYFTVLYCAFLYVLFQHARELQTTDGDMYLNTLSPGSSNKREATLVGIPSAQNMWRVLSRGSALGRWTSIRRAFGGHHTASSIPFCPFS